MIWFLLLLLAQPPTVPGRGYHLVALEKMATTTRTHAVSCGLVVYRRKMADGDWHVTLSRGEDLLVLEIIPAMPLEPPTKGQTIEAWGITRIDRGHKTKRYPAGWPELHPLEGFRVAADCQPFSQRLAVQTARERRRAKA